MEGIPMRKKRITVGLAVAAAVIAVAGAGAAYAAGRDDDGCTTPTQLTSAVGPAGTTGAGADASGGPACVPAVGAVPAK
jgi:hypothetical protein